VAVVVAETLLAVVVDLVVVEVVKVLQEQASALMELQVLVVVVVADHKCNLHKQVEAVVEL